MLEAIPVEWMNLVTLRVTEKKVVQVKERRLAGVGYLGEHRLLLLQGEGDEEVGRLVIKLPPSHPESLQMVLSYGIFDTECRFYLHVDELTLPLSCARILPPIFPQKGDPLDQKMLALPFCPGVGPTFQQGMSREETVQAMKAVAELHSNFLTLPEAVSRRPHWLTDGNSDPERTIQLFLDCFNSNAIERLDQVWAPCLSPEERKELYEKYLTRDGVERVVDQTVGKSYQGPRSLCHGDLWSGNLLFEEDSVTLIDWQFANFSNPVIDVGLLLCSSTNIDWEEETDIEHFVGYYHQVLSQIAPQGSPWGTWSGCLASFQEALPYVLLVLCASIESWMPNAEETVVGQRYRRLTKYVVTLDRVPT